MIELERLYKVISAVVFNGRPPDPQQKEIMTPGPADPLFIVAGPGTGKTTSLTLRILKLILVDAVPAKGILATTFTRKAASELRSRILGWGYKIREALLADKALTAAQRAFVEGIDINQVQTGTIDSICEQVLRDHRDPGTTPPILADEFATKSLLFYEGVLSSGSHRDDDLRNFLGNIRGGMFGFNVQALTHLLGVLWDRRHYDQTSWDSMEKAASGPDKAQLKKVDDILIRYKAALEERQMVDFTLLEQTVLERLKAGKLAEWTKDIKVVLVDEFQDTNLLQFEIYFQLARRCNGALIVVGDDDQSLYRFRGATIELFTDFPKRYQHLFGKKISPSWLSNNYRSSGTIRNFVNDYATLDKKYQQVRVKGKPILNGPAAAKTDVPIFALFRDTREELAKDLADIIKKVFAGKGWHGKDVSVVRDPKNGRPGDCAILCSSPNDVSASGNPRLPLLLRDELGKGAHPIQIFNPRGQEFPEIEIVKVLGGLLLEAIDPYDADGRVQDLLLAKHHIPQETFDTFEVWRKAASDYVDSKRPDLLAYALGWADRDPKRSGTVWPRSESVLTLVYGLTHYLDSLHNDPEHHVYLEVFTRQLTACENIRSFGGRLIYDPAAKPNAQGLTLPQLSQMELLRDWLGPIATGAVGVDEGLMEEFPRDRVSVLSIHQSKGLEFPMVIVDVGSDFKDLRSKPFHRFPTTGDMSHTLEDLLRPHSSDAGLAGAVGKRAPQDRAFDDLYRRFFVAFSRPQDVLILAGLRPCLPGGRVPNVATGLARDGKSPWATKAPWMEI